MHNVPRFTKPNSLHRNGTRWRRELLTALSSSDPNKELITRRVNRYKQDDIRTALEQMYGGLCCYCESRIPIVAFGHIEHRKPKKSQPEYTFDWDNLHLACPVCNQAKSDKWNDDYPILDSVQDTISEHLSYKVDGVKRWPESHRGTTTIEHAALNRQELRDARMVIAFRVLDIICALNQDPDSPTAGLVRAELEEKISGEYGSLINWLLASFMRDG